MRRRLIDELAVLRPRFLVSFQVQIIDIRQLKASIKRFLAGRVDFKETLKLFGGGFIIFIVPRLHGAFSGFRVIFVTSIKKQYKNQTSCEKENGETEKAPVGE